MLLHRLRSWEPAKVSPNIGLRNAGRRRRGLLGPVLREACLPPLLSPVSTVAGKHQDSRIRLPDSSPAPGQSLAFATLVAIDVRRARPQLNLVNGLEGSHG